MDEYTRIKDYGYQAYDDACRALGGEFAEDSAPASERVEQEWDLYLLSCDSRQVEEEDRLTPESFGDAFLRGWREASRDDGEKSAMEEARNV